MRADVPPASTSPSLPVGLAPAGRFARWRSERPGYVLCDVDGTLVGVDGVATTQVREAATRAVDAGLAVGLATGRGAGGVASLADRLGLPGPHVLANGAQVAEGGRVVHTTALAPEVLDAVLDLGVYVEVYVDDDYWVSSPEPGAERHWELLGREPAGRIADGGFDRERIAKLTVVELEGPPDPSLPPRLEALGAKIGTSTSPATPEMTFHNVTDPAADKGTALRVAAERLGIGVGQVVAVGDERNDLTMLEVAGTAVAMGQSEPDIVAAAHLVTTPVADDGAARVFDAAVVWARGG